MWTRKRKPDDTKLDMTPLVDVVFLLIVFFMLSTTFIVLPGIRIDLPEATSQKIKLKKNKVVVSIHAEGDLFFGKDRVDRSAMLRRLQDAAAENPETLVLIKGDRGVDYGRIIDTLDMARRAGLQRIGMVTVKKKPAEPGNTEKK